MWLGRRHRLPDASLATPWEQDRRRDPRGVARRRRASRRNNSRNFKERREDLKRDSSEQNRLKSYHQAGLRKVTDHVDRSRRKSFLFT